MIPKDTIVHKGPRIPKERQGLTSGEVLDRVFEEDFEEWLDFIGDFGYYFNAEDGTYYKEGDR